MQPRIFCYARDNIARDFFFLTSLLFSWSSIIKCLKHRGESIVIRKQVFKYSITGLKLLLI